MKNKIHIILSLTYIIAGAIILNKKTIKNEIKYSQSYLEQKRLISFIYQQKTILK